MILWCLIFKIEVISRLSSLAIKFLFKMKVLHTLEKAFTFVIIRGNCSDSRKNLHRFQLFWASTTFSVGPILLILFLYLEAKTLEEYEETFYPLATLVTCGSIFLVFIWNKTEIFRVIDSFNEIIESRKFLIVPNSWDFLVESNKPEWIFVCM